MANLMIGKGISCARWNRLCSPKVAGGLGFWKLYEFNLALLSQQGWKLITDPSWHSIWITRDLRKHSRMRVGDGGNIRVMMDPWLPTQDSGFITTPLGSEYECLGEGLSASGFSPVGYGLD